MPIVRQRTYRRRTVFGAGQRTYVPKLTKLDAAKIQSAVDSIPNVDHNILSAALNGEKTVVHVRTGAMGHHSGGHFVLVVKVGRDWQVKYVAGWVK